MMSVKKFLTAAAVAAALAGAGSPAMAQSAEGVAAIVNDRVISTFDVRQRANLLMMSAGMDPTPELEQRVRTQALRDLIDETLQLQETAEFDIAIADTDIDRRLADIARQNETDVATLTASLASRGVSVSTLRAQIQADMAWSRLMGGLYGSRLRISDSEITATQERIAANLTRPQYQISEIFLPAENEREFSEMEQGALRLLQEMQRGAPFPLVARQFSRSPSAAAGGDIGWIAANELSPELQPIAERLQPGQVSMPVRTPSGVYLIAVRDRRAGGTAGASSQVLLYQVTAPAERQADLERVRRRGQGCANIERQIANIQGAAFTDLGESAESDLSPAIRGRISGIASGAASPVVVNGAQADMIMVCARETGGGGVPDRTEIEARLREQEMNMLAERHLRNVRREATIITR
ncbi:MAG: peptidylprolyl isomerase [Alphaproteobacteria bacterium]|nr:MAG: peptidylprolyl isomerase [Alphaproteobacteria bacterium]